MIRAEIPRVRRAFAAAVALASLVACAGDGPIGPQTPAELTELPRALSAGETMVRDAANNFSLSLWARVNQAERGKNVFMSPLSVSLALGMTTNGAANETQQEMRQTLAFGNATMPEINESYESLIALLTSLDPTVEMKIGNSIWYRQGFPARSAFLETVSNYFGATSEALDFSQAASLATINKWASDATNQRIPKVLDRIDPNDVMFLVNAIYFKGDWRSRFDPKLTHASTFHSATGASQTTQLMRRTGGMKYLQNSALQAVQLPYGNGAFVMNVLLPAEGSDIDNFASSIDPAWLADESYYTSEVDLSLPKVRLEYERLFKGDLQSLGMQRAFSPGAADFTGLADPPAGNGLFISFVKNNSFVDIHEEGTEAAAVTVVGIRETSAPQVAVMRVDRPYVFVIRERLSGTILFMGKIAAMP